MKEKIGKDEIIEIVSDVNLRKIYELEDEDNCTIYIEDL